VRILFVAPYVPSLIRVRPFNLIRELAKRHEISLLASGSINDSHDAAALLTACKTVEVVPLRLAAMARSCLEAALQGFPLQSAICISPALRHRLARLLSTGDFDVIHIEHLRAARLIELVPSTMPAVFDSVDCISLLLERTLNGSHSRWQRGVAALELRRTRRLESMLVQRFDRVSVTSPDDAQAMGDSSREPAVAVIPNGVDLAYYQPRDVARDRATLVLSGKMSYHANVTAALFFVKEIFPLVRQSRPGVHLAIVGSNPPSAIRALGRDPAITVTGHVEDMREPLSRASIAVCPVTVKVGIQNKILEAMAMGLPVVSTRQGIEGLNVRPGRDLLVGENPAEFAVLVCRLLDNDLAREELGVAGRRFVEANHRWDAASTQMEDLYRSAIASRAMR
jgi:polysaccharide biosynthesis protein PslH